MIPCNCNNTNIVFDRFYVKVCERYAADAWWEIPTGNVSNVSVIDVFVSIINVFERFYVKVWQDEQVMNGCNAFNVSGGKR